jgi:DNA polymerase III subunit gamma/tau
MSYLALARRYRPGDFGNIVSQQHVTKTLQNAVKSGRIAHAYLFSGPRGTGKTTTARVLAKALNCAKGPTPEPCGECPSCKEITAGSSPDVFEIDAASNRGIDDIRELRENVRYSPVGGRYKVYIIDEVHRLTKEAFDALLKTLEEPPSHVIFIFATTDPQALPPTILSRTQKYDFKRIPVTALADAITSVAEKEGLKIEQGAALLIAKKADGSLRDGLSLLDQLSSFSDGPIDAERTAEVLGLVKIELLEKLSKGIIGRDIAGALNLFGEFTKSGGDSQELADSLSGYMRTLLLIKSGVTDTELLELDPEEIKNGKEMIAELDTVDLLRYFTILADYKGAVKQGQDPIYLFEATIIKLATLDRAIALEALLNKKPESSFPRPSTPSAISNSSKGIKPAEQPKSTIRKMAEQADEPAMEPEQISKSSVTPTNGQSLTLKFITDTWSGYCEHVKQTRKTTFGYLSLCAPNSIDGEVLVLTADIAHKFQLEQLGKPDNKRFIEDSLREYYKCEIKLKLVVGEAGLINGPGPTLSKSPEKLFEGSPEAKELFDSLGGEIIGQ